MLGIVIANWNAEQLIKKCLDSFLIQTYTNFKLYIVDNGSSDESLNVIKSYTSKLKIEVIELSENNGFAKANNIGIQKAIEDKCDYILTLNNDTELVDETLMNAMQEVYKNEYDVYQLMMVNFFERDLCDACGITWDEKLLPIQLGYKEKLANILKKDIELKGACAGAAIYSVKALLETKLSKDEYFCNEFFAYYEDVDLAIRLYRKNFKTKLLKNALVYHVHSATGKKSSGFKEYYLYRNMFMYTKRNQPKFKYNKNKFKYNKIVLGAIKNNLKNKDVLKSLFKALIDGNKKAKNISYE